MKRIIVFHLFLTVLFSFNLFPQESCVDALIHELDVTTLTTDEKLAYLDIVNSQNYESRKQNINAVIPQIGSLGFDEYENRRNEFFALHDFSRDIHTSYKRIIKKISKENWRAYRACIATNHIGLFINIEEEHEDYAIFKVTNRIEGSRTDVQNEFTIDIEGGEYEGDNSFQLRRDGTRIFHVRRIEQNDIAFFVTERNNANYELSKYSSSTIPDTPHAPCSNINLNGTWIGHHGAQQYTMFIEQTGCEIKAQHHAYGYRHYYKGTVSGNMISFTIRRHIPDGRSHNLYGYFKIENSNQLIQYVTGADPGLDLPANYTSQVTFNKQ